MAGFLDFVFGIFSIALFIFGIWWLIKRKNPDKPQWLGKAALISLIGAFVFYNLYSITPEGKNKQSAEDRQETQKKDKSTSKKKVKQESQAKAESKKQADKKKLDSEGKTVIELFDDMNDQEISKYNAGLAKELSSDQQDAETVEAYAWSAFVDTTEYVKNRGFQVDVTSEFLTLNEKERKSVINSAQNFGTSEFLFMDKNLSEDPGFTNTNIYYNGNRIGHSKLTDESDFKWTD
ncbi:hypothetical protein OXT66_05895 [Lentilactobacillus senioris]|uniref:hypothetical protein n=1 Tax=Lentilactobacillus senioris TaxID=931534 RepID=UPI0022808434|nr:hypothetical protein [Lentilactobacillus senioris]MCY9807082.1 hypothetical protein [Lentilactobacillus senioris]